MSRILAPAVLIGLLLVIWEAATRLLRVPGLCRWPPPSAICEGVSPPTPALLAASRRWRTLEMAMLALVCAAIFAGALALIVSLSPILDRAIRPLAVALQVTPVVAIAPLTVIWAGVDHPERAVIALAAIVAFFPIFSGTARGLAAADPDLERLFDLYGATPLQRLARLKLPSALPFIVEGAARWPRGSPIIGAVVAEFVAGSGGEQGLAWRILEAGNHLETAKMFAAILALALMAAAVQALFQWLERRALVWWRGR